MRKQGECRRRGERAKRRRVNTVGVNHRLTVSGRRTHYVRIGILYRLLRWQTVPPIKPFSYSNTNFAIEES